MPTLAALALLFLVAGSTTPSKGQTLSRLFVTVSASPGTVQVGQPVVVGYSVINPNPGDPLRGIFVDFGDGSNQQLPTVPASGTVQHSYSNTGAYTVDLSAVSTGMIAGEAITTVIVGPPVRTFGPVPAPLSSSATCSWTGLWDTGQYGQLQIVQSGSSASGSYAYFGNPPTYTLVVGTIGGGVSGNTLLGNWFEPPVYTGQYIGVYQFTMNPGCNSFTGLWAYPLTPSGSWDGTWNGTRIQ